MGYIYISTNIEQYMVNNIWDIYIYIYISTNIEQYMVILVKQYMGVSENRLNP